MVTVVPPVGTPKAGVTEVMVAAKPAEANPKSIKKTEIVTATITEVVPLTL
jgi:hypothetical protein